MTPLPERREMVERCARSIFDLFQRKDPTEGRTFEGCDPEVQETLREVASAAIEAMREPTKEMVERVWGALENYDFSAPDACSVTHAYRAAIDAALSRAAGVEVVEVEGG